MAAKWPDWVRFAAKQLNRSEAYVGTLTLRFVLVPWLGTPYVEWP